MAIGGKTLGITAGLAVGLTSGVILAALNPVVPKKDDVAVVQATVEETAEPAETAVAEPNVAENSEPEPQTEVEPTETVIAEDSVTTAEPEAPIEPEISAEPPKTGDAETLAQVAEPEIELALALPETTSLPNPEAPAQLETTQGEDQPNLSTAPADAVKLDEPTAQTDSPKVGAAQIVSEETPTATSTSEPKIVAEPAQITATEDKLAALPKITDPEAPKPAAVVTEEPAAEVVEEPKPNTSGTFKTTGGSIITKGARLPKIGDDQPNTLASLGTGQKKSRFKTIGDDTEIADAETTTEITPDAGALVRNANDFPVTDEPLLSIILIDDGKIADQLSGLKNLNLPLAIAISLDEPDAIKRAVNYRNAGFEVLTMSPRDVKLSLSGGQSPAQVATLLDQYFKMMPMSLGLIDRPSANLQKDQRLARSVVKHFETTGHGLITYAGGLNSTKRIADQAGVSSGAVFRFLDKSGETGTIITQQLDRAAREARNKGAVIVLATPSKEMLGTLVGWSLSSKARTVKIAPVSASLLKD